MRNAIGWSALFLGFALAVPVFAADAPAPAPDLLASLPGSWKVDPSGTPLDAEAIHSLDTGSVLNALSDVPDNPVKKGMAIGVVNGTPAKVIGTLTDYEHFPDFMPYVAKIVVDKNEGKTALVSYWLEFPLGVGNRNYQLDLKDDRKTVEGKNVYVIAWTYTGKGNIKDTTGGWEVAPWGDGTRSFVRYTVFTDPGGSIPNWIKNRAASTAISKVVKKVQERVLKPEAAKPVDY